MRSEKRYQRLIEKCLATDGKIFSSGKQIGGLTLKVCNIDITTRGEQKEDCKYCNRNFSYPVCMYYGDERK